MPGYCEDPPPLAGVIGWLHKHRPRVQACSRKGAACKSRGRRLERVLLVLGIVWFWVAVWLEGKKLKEREARASQITFGGNQDTCTY